MVESLPSKEANQFFWGSLCPSGKQAAYFLPLILVANDRRATISTYKQPLFKAASATPVCSGLCFGLVFFGLFRLFALLLRPLHVISLATHTQLLTGKSFFCWHLGMELVQRNSSPKIMFFDALKQEANSRCHRLVFL